MRAVQRKHLKANLIQLLKLSGEHKAGKLIKSFKICEEQRSRRVSWYPLSMSVSSSAMLITVLLQRIEMGRRKKQKNNAVSGDLMSVSANPLKTKKKCFLDDTENTQNEK